MTRRQQTRAAVLDDLRDEDLDEQAPERVVWEQRERENMIDWGFWIDREDDRREAERDTNAWDDMTDRTVELCRQIRYEEDIEDHETSMAMDRALANSTEHWP